MFRGRGWDGVDAHWRANHESVEPYETFFANLCDQHRWMKAPLVASSDRDLKNEARTITRFLAGKKLQAIYRPSAGQLVIQLTDGSRLIVDHLPEGLELSIQE